MDQRQPVVDKDDTSTNQSLPPPQQQQQQSQKPTNDAAADDSNNDTIDLNTTTTAMCMMISDTVAASSALMGENIIDSPRCSSTGNRTTGHNRSINKNTTTQPRQLPHLPHLNIDPTMKKNDPTTTTTVPTTTSTPNTTTTNSINNCRNSNNNNNNNNNYSSNSSNAVSVGIVAQGFAWAKQQKYHRQRQSLHHQAEQQLFKLQLASSSSNNNNNNSSSSTGAGNNKNNMNKDDDSTIDNHTDASPITSIHQQQQRQHIDDDKPGSDDDDDDDDYNDDDDDDRVVNGDSTKYYSNTTATSTTGSVRSSSLVTTSFFDYRSSIPNWIQKRWTNSPTITTTTTTSLSSSSSSSLDVSSTTHPNLIVRSNNDENEDDSSNHDTEHGNNSHHHQRLQFCNISKSGVGYSVNLPDLFHSYPSTTMTMKHRITTTTTTPPPPPTTTTTTTTATSNSNDDDNDNNNNNSIENDYDDDDDTSWIPQVRVEDATTYDDSIDADHSFDENDANHNGCPQQQQHPMNDTTNNNTVAHTTVRKIYPPYLLSTEEMYQIAVHVLPRNIVYCKWKRYYSLVRDGDSFDNCLRQISHCKQSLLIVHTTKNHRFGAYVDAPWDTTHSQQHGTIQYYGGPETCLFKIMNDTNTHSATDGNTNIANNDAGNVIPNMNDSNTTGSSSRGRSSSKVICYRWSGMNRYIQLCDHQNKMIAIGGGNGTFGLCIQQDFQYGSTGTCTTFNNEPLCPDEQFHILNVEIYGFLLGQF